MKRINDKIIDIEKFIEELNQSIPEDFEEYKNDFKARAIGERYFEKIIESVVDLAFLIIKEKKFKQPEEDKEAFDILSKENIITKNLADKLKSAKGMRNIIAHEYGRIDNELVFQSLAEELIPDVEEFIKQINKILN
jgi:uncharacterized protein YutE (UPF0331/DUF86 family)